MDPNNPIRFGHTHTPNCTSRTEQDLLRCIDYHDPFSWRGHTPLKLVGAVVATCLATWDYWSEV